MKGLILSAVILLPSLPPGLNPLFLNQEGHTAVVEMLYVSPLRLGSRGEVKNYAARLVSLQGQRAVLEVLEGFTWEGGEPLSAGDIAFTYNFLAHYRKNPTHPYWKGIKAYARGKRVVIFFPSPPEKYHFLTPVLPERILRRSPPEELKRLPFSGPYRVVKTSPAKIVLERRKSFPLKTSFQKIVLLEVPDPVTRRMMMEAGQGDVCLCSRGNLPGRGFKIYKISRPAFLYLGFRGLSPSQRCWVAERLRGVDFSSLSSGFARPITSPFQVWFPFPDIRLECKGKIPTRHLTLMVPAMRERLLLAQLIQSALAPLRVRVLSLERGIFIKRLRAGNFSLALSGFSLDFPSDLKEVLGCGGAVNYFGYCSREMDRALSKGDWKRGHEIFLRDLPFLPLYVSLYPIAVRRGLGWAPFETSFSSASPFRSIVQ